MAAVKKVGQKNGEVGLLVEYLFCGPIDYSLIYQTVRCRRYAPSSPRLIDFTGYHVP